MIQVQLLLHSLYHDDGGDDEAETINNGICVSYDPSKSSSVWLFSGVIAVRSIVTWKLIRIRVLSGVMLNTGTKPIANVHEQDPLLSFVRFFFGLLRATRLLKSEV
jgi:hypothetical protein